MKITQKLRELGFNEKQVQFLRRWVYRNHSGFRSSTITDMFIQDNEFNMLNIYDEIVSIELKYL